MFGRLLPGAMKRGIKINKFVTGIHRNMTGHPDEPRSCNLRTNGEMVTPYVTMNSGQMIASLYHGTSAWESAIARPSAIDTNVSATK